MSIEAMKQALEALEKCRVGFEYTRQYVGYETLHAIEGWSWYDGDVAAIKAITSLRQAIAEAEKQEPVAIKIDDASTGTVYVKWLVDECLIPVGTEFYTSTPQRQWVGLDWYQMPEIYMNDKAFEHGAQWAESFLKEKNT